jgi:hypothetical protein
MCDISGPIFIDLTKIYCTEKYHRTVNIGYNTQKFANLEHRSIFFYLSNHQFIDLEILQIPKSPFLKMVFRFLSFFMLFMLKGKV